MSQRNEVPLLILSLLLTLGILGAGYWFLKDHLFSKTSISPNQSTPSSPSLNPPLNSTLITQSWGETLLIVSDITPQKTAGIQAFSQGNYAQAITYWQDSLKVKRNDPETLIYLNNAQAQNHNPLKIAVVVPIGKSENIAKEILRGVAQGQQQINQKGGINGRYLQVLIVNDNNDPITAAEVARQLVKNQAVLAVIGHNSSDATLGATPEYEKGELVMISPTSNANQISTQGDYIFRTIPSVRFEANALSRYTINQAQKTKIAVCFDSQAQYSLPFKEDFTSAIFSDGGQLIEINCDLSDPNFNALDILAQAKQQGAEGILLIPSVDRIPAAIAIAQANQNQLLLLGSSTLYTFETLQKGRNFVEGMIIPIPWYPTAFEGITFPQDAVNLWGGAVNWRSALAYDATQVLITAFQQNTTRQGIQTTLADPNFRSQGATGIIRFLASGDRQSAPIFTKVASQPQSKSNTGFDFILIQSSN